MDEIKILSGTERLETLEATATADREVGDVQIINGLVCVAYETIANGEVGRFIHQSELAVAPSGVTDADAAGKAAYWDASDSQVTTTSTDNTKCGMFLGPITSGEEADFRLDNSINL
ncbi:DUF2190 family protein [Natronospira bacteriovora]|uniref:DUF2190 family protein n=1 Tax=Natronospira bacteriovora TaxID=3069753 RepID=A0ABU0W5W5_9GAMM|nr:DUF2190 family protein [Natronospira sp. AB-CW4]MDQ2069323.1 DUF2190 family protein [Natronospira sp. AB-CW4]